MLWQHGEQGVSDQLQSMTNIVTGERGMGYALSRQYALFVSRVSWAGWGVEEGDNLRLFFPSKAAVPDLWRVFAAS